MLRGSEACGQNSSGDPASPSFRCRREGRFTERVGRGIDLDTGIDKLKMLGRLLSFSALLDLWMTGEEQMKQYVQEIMETEAENVDKGP